MKIIRYSTTAFTPQKQIHHIKLFESWINLNPKDYAKIKRRKNTLLQST